MYDLFTFKKRILITGGAGFIGGTLTRRLLRETKSKIFNIDKLGYASDLIGINQTLKDNNIDNSRYQFLHIDLEDFQNTKNAIKISDPDLVFHLAAESHVDRSIYNPEIFLKSNIMGTFNLLENLRVHWQNLESKRKKDFRILHISTDEVFGSLDTESDQFDEKTPYNPRNPYSASKAAADHIARSWFHTFGLPITVTNCSNNYGPWQFPEKLIPVTILMAAKKMNIPLYGNGLNIRDWLFVEDHIDALLLASSKGSPGKTYCIGGMEEKNNKHVVEDICKIMDSKQPNNSPHSKLITYVEDRKGHDKRYSINPELISRELGWKRKHKFKKGLDLTVNWYLENLDWCEAIIKNNKQTNV